MNEQKEKYLETKTNSCLPKRKTPRVEITFQELETLLKSLTNLSKKIVNGQVDIELE